jgi:hypothetical protein
VSARLLLSLTTAEVVLTIAYHHRMFAFVENATRTGGMVLYVGSARHHRALDAGETLMSALPPKADIVQHADIHPGLLLPQLRNCLATR